MPPRPKVDENDIEEKFLKGSGPGGQKINKTSSAVQLRHIPTGIVVKSQETRSREQNRKIARQLLASKLEDIEKGDQSRNSVINETKKKKKASKRKKSLRKYRQLDGTKAAAVGKIAGEVSGLAGEIRSLEELEDEDAFDGSDEDGNGSEEGEGDEASDEASDEAEGDHTLVGDTTISDESQPPK